MNNCKCGKQINDGEHCCSSCAVDAACEGIPAETYDLIDRLSKRCANTITTFPNLSRDCGEAVGTIRTIEGKIKRRDQTIVELRAELTRLLAELETANLLVKRYEAALEWMSQEQHSIHSYSYDCGNSYGVYSNGDRRYISEAKSTPLDAIEAAMKEKS